MMDGGKYLAYMSNTLLKEHLLMNVHLYMKIHFI
jgi:hypothetical protein